MILNADDGMEQAVTQAWTQALQLPEPDFSRSFLALGGDSLKATLACGRLSRELGRTIPLRTLLEAPMLGAFIRGIQALPDSAPHSAASGPSPLTPGLSCSQERMAYMQELAVGTAAYHVSMAWRLRGRIDEAALLTALADTFQAHPELLTTITMQGEQLLPGFGHAMAPTVGQHSLERVREARREDALESYLCEFANGPFHLDSGPLARSAVIRMDHEQVVVALVLHHVVADQWALDVFFRDMATAYSARLSGGVALSASGPSFEEIAAAQRLHLQRHEPRQATYWQEQLRGLEPTVLNEDYVRPPQQGFAGARLRMDFGLREILALRALGAAHGATLAMVLLTALKLLLSRHTGRDDIAVGLPVANRAQPESWNRMGTLVNTLVLRTQLDPADGFIGALARVRTAMIGALDNQDLPFERLVRAMHLERDPSRPPLFTVMFNMLNTPLGKAELPGITWSRREFDRKASQFDLTVAIDAEHARSISFEYSTELFAADTIRRLADQYMALLKAVLRDATGYIGPAMIIPDSERRLLRQWAQGERLARTAGTVDDLLWPSFRQHHGRVAVVCGDQSWSYAELGRAADCVAHALVAAGIGRGSLVGLHLRRSPRMLAALLGVLRSGAAYVPLDPAFPENRLAYMARDAGLHLVLGEDDAAPGMWPEHCRALSIDEALRADPDTLAPPRGSHPADPAYVIYTSGSTGEPKGVVVPHGAVVNFLRSMRHEPGLAAEDRLLAITTLSFDIAVLELLLPLTVGALVVIARQEDQTDGEALRRLLLAHHITVMQGTPSTWRVLLDSGWSGSSDLRALVGGEPLTRDLANELLARCSEVWNMYGPTETTVWSSCGRVEPQGRERISLGRPIANTEILVLDEHLSICPAGVPGEICIGGDGVATGYLNRPALTAERFIAHPHSRDRRATRLYRTGDRGRWRPDGRLEHLGRMDSQVKIRGYRIELGEIEARLGLHADVESATVIAWPQGSETRLVAYIVMGLRPPGARELREHLRQWLPEYMIPQHFISIPAIPRLPNGKLDKHALPSPATAVRDGGPVVPPGNVLEEALWQVWRQVLRSEAFGIHDNLFEIGGHSLLAIQIVNRIRSQLQRHCSLSLLLRNPTISQLAQAIAGGTKTPGATAVALQPGGAEPALFCLCGIMIYRELADALAPDIPVTAVFVPEEMAILRGTAAAGTAPDVQSLAHAYLEVIRSHQPHGPYRLLGFSFGGVVAYEAAQQLRATGQAVSLLCIVDSDVPGAGTTGLWQRFKQAARRLVTPTDRSAEPYINAMRRYQPQPYPGAVFRVKSADRPTYDPGHGWERLLVRESLLRLDDTHTGLLKGQSVGQLVANLRRHLEDASPANDQNHLTPPSFGRQ